MSASGMRHALAPASDSKLSARLTARRDGFQYEVWRDGAKLRYRVSRGDESFETALAWAFGSGHTGQTWVFERDGRWIETRVSHYPSIQGLDLTVGAANAAPASLDEAIGRPMSAADAKECFGCHTTQSAEPASFRPGLECGACHGPAAPHLEALRKGSGTAMPNPGRASSEEISEFCGQCHRTWEQVMLMGVRGINTIRFQPYRLTLSKCYDAGDRRASCVACHDPHKPAARSARDYDRACLACHTQLNPCKSGASGECASCHMPKLELPGAHTKFTDHRIRVARPGEPFPD